MNQSGWSLEVVRGLEVGRRYALVAASTVLGNALEGAAGLDLGHQEGNGPRRMAARQAQIEVTSQEVLLRDLDSPGGTFLNRQRVLSGQALKLKQGDLIQVGGVQLKLVLDASPGEPDTERLVPSPPPQPRGQAETRPAASQSVSNAPRQPRASQPNPPASVPPPGPRRTSQPPPPPPVDSSPAPRPPQPTRPVPAREPQSRPTSPGPVPAPSQSGSRTRSTGGRGLPVPFVLLTGTECRTWEDLLTVSAQRWEALRDELTSGRLAAFLAANRLAGFAPSASAPGSPDERLDAWLAQIPTTTEALPELDIHPGAILVRAVPGGGVTRQSVAITNTGYRLLRSSIRIEPESAAWISVPSNFSAGSIVTVDRTEVPLDIRIPEVLTAAWSGGFVVDSNGGSQRVSVRIERRAEPDSIPELSSARYGAGGPNVLEWIERVPFGRRLALTCVGGLLLRCLVGLGELLPVGRQVAGGTGPLLLGPLLILALVGGVVAAILAARRAEARDIPAAGFAGACFGVFTAAIAVALCRAVEPMLGVAASHSIWGSGLIWIGLSTGVAGLSMMLVPPRLASAENPS